MIPPILQQPECHSNLSSRQIFRTELNTGRWQWDNYLMKNSPWECQGTCACTHTHSRIFGASLSCRHCDDYFKETIPMMATCANTAWFFCWAKLFPSYKLCPSVWEMWNSLRGRAWAEQSRFYSYLRKPLGALHAEEAQLVVLHGALGVSAQVAALQVPRILAACRQLCLPSSSTVTAVLSGSGELAHSSPSRSRALCTTKPLLPPGWLWGTSPGTTAELTHR